MSFTSSITKSSSNSIGIGHCFIGRFNGGSDYIHVHVAAMNLEKFEFRARNLTMSDGVHFSFLKDVRLDEFQWLNDYRIFNRRKPTKQTTNKMLKTVSSLGDWFSEHLSNILSKVNLPSFENLTSLSVEFWPNEYTRTCSVTHIEVMERLYGEAIFT